MAKLPRPKFKEKQTPKERKRAATGRISAMTTQAGDKPLSMAVYRSFTDKQRADALVQAGKDLRAGKITQKEFDAIEKKIDAADNAAARKASVKAQLAATGKKKITLPDALPPRKAETSKPSGKKDPRDMTKKELAAFVKQQEEEGKKVAARYKAKNLNKGGYGNGKKNMYNKGGYVNAGASVAGTQKWTAG
jgi:hypothetical protein